MLTKNILKNSMINMFYLRRYLKEPYNWNRMNLLLILDRELSLLCSWLVISLFSMKEVHPLHFKSNFRRVILFFRLKMFVWEKTVCFRLEILKKVCLNRLRIFKIFFRRLLWLMTRTKWWMNYFIKNMIHLKKELKRNKKWNSCIHVK